ncbi:MAG: DUF202 domain-containing protein [Beutenbergiaceae bacterium]
MRRVHSDLNADGGAQPQRTMLAWNRTVLAAVVGSSVVAVTAQRQQLPVLAAVAVLTALGMLIVVVRDMREWGNGGSHYALMRHVVVTVVVLAGLGTAIAVQGIIR